MALNRKKSGGGGGANWMDTYGDMVTLLLCFFVLLYSMSTISEENWKALVMSFNPDAAKIPSASPGGAGPSAEGDDAGVMPNDQPDEETQANIDNDIAQHTVIAVTRLKYFFISDPPRYPKSNNLPSVFLHKNPDLSTNRPKPLWFHSSLRNRRGY